ncbi:MAG: 30S ribosomal protein S20 [Patescibacteria group bacterium]
MPKTHSAQKALRQSKKRRAQNINRKKKLKATIKEYKKSAADKPAETKEILAELYKNVDKAAKAKIIKKNTAARLKSRLSRLVKTAR